MMTDKRVQATTESSGRAGDLRWIAAGGGHPGARRRPDPLGCRGRRATHLASFSVSVRAGPSQTPPRPLLPPRARRHRLVPSGPAARRPLGDQMGYGRGSALRDGSGCGGSSLGRGCSLGSACRLTADSGTHNPCGTGLHRGGYGAHASMDRVGHCHRHRCHPTLPPDQLLKHRLFQLHPLRLQS